MQQIFQLNYGERVNRLGRCGLRPGIGPSATYLLLSLTPRFVLCLHCSLIAPMARLSPKQAFVRPPLITQPAYIDNTDSRPTGAEPIKILVTAEEPITRRVAFGPTGCTR